MEVGNTCKINGIEYIVLATFEKYSMLLNNAESEVNGSGNVIIVEDIDGKNARVVKDKMTIAYVVQQILKDEKNKEEDENK
ncbi:MAG: hypothetical protein IJW32_02170 [Clostridia bacterium]|nr:hypothetical protein [Clostridia bacterium]